MTNVQSQSEEQDRWNQFAKRRIEQLLDNPGQYVIRESPFTDLPTNDLTRLLAPLEGKRILELGCGLGQFSVYLATQGAKVTGVDIGADLVDAARLLAKVNQVDCEFHTANIVSLPAESNSYDVVVGLHVLHHLSQSDVSKALSDVHRVLKVGGMAVFIEPVENSKLFNFIQNLVPAGTRASGYYRPSIIQRKAWNEYVRSLDDRDMTNRELLFEGQKYFRSVRLFPYGFLSRLERLTGEKYSQTLTRLDRLIFRVFPPLTWLSQTVLVEYGKE